MSVVNDVLRDLHQRRTQRKYAHSLPFSYDSAPTTKPDNLVIVFFILSVLLITSSLYFFVMTNLIKENEPFNDLEIVTPIKFNQSDILTDNMVVTESSVKNSPTVLDELDHIKNNDAEIKTQVKSWSKRLDTTDKIDEKIVLRNLAVAKKEIIDAVLKDAEEPEPFTKIVTVKRDPTSINNRSQGDDLIKKLMISEPEKVWPYIKKLLPITNDKVSLLALGAQGEQRSNHHNTALSLYATLSKLEPNEAKWKVGSAISLDALSEKKQAIKSYQQALELSPLPPALYSFVRQRIDQLKGLSHE